MGSPGQPTSERRMVLVIVVVFVVVFVVVMAGSSLYLW
jgi:hypothetical protein